MRRIGGADLAVLAVVGLMAGLALHGAPLAQTAAPASQRAEPTPPEPGRHFQSAESQANEADETTNPGMLWVEQGREQWSKVEPATGKSCASCHADATRSMAGVAARYPAVDATSGRLLNLEQRIQQCRTEHQGGPPLAWETNELLGLTAYVTRQSLGRPKAVAINGPASVYFEAGRTFFETRQGQLNLACAQCHTDHWGRRLRGDRISQGQTDGWPAYRLDWQTLGSLHRRLRACSLGVRADVQNYGAPDYVAVELYLAWRGKGLPVASPGIRR